jgi:hypothetical protein
MPRALLDCRPTWSAWGWDMTGQGREPDSCVLKRPV